ncbi:MAG: hypothetical protein MZV64_17625 [Ignavibacteriales bacterium]|nr:hypothetical protein [Ignavibacteriales bacterium]
MILYNWADYMPQSVLDAFTAEYGVEVTVPDVRVQCEEACSPIERGQRFDVVVLEHDFIPSLVADGLLAEIDYRNVPNFKNISRQLPRPGIMIRVTLIQFLIIMAQLA